jgi:hypothetical protein
MSFSIKDASGKSRCGKCDNLIKRGERQLDIQFGSGWPQPRVVHGKHFHLHCFLFWFQDEIEELYKKALEIAMEQPKKQLPGNPDARIQGILETME